MKGIALRLLSGGAVVATVMTVIAAPASAAVTTPVAPTVDVATPHPGDFLRRGSDWVLGVACDPNASANDSTAGIARVQVFLGDRDAGGSFALRPGGFIGSATLAGTNPANFDTTSGLSSRLSLQNPDTSTCKNPLAGWRVLTAAMKRRGTFDMNIYVLAKNGMETKVTLSGIRIDEP
jgi:hypothetical protein